MKDKNLWMMDDLF
jgi:hypothetical protein